MSREKDKEEVLIQRIIEGDEIALRVFWRMYVPKLFAFICGKVSNVADAEEILQDTLLGGLERLRDFQGRSMFSTYLCAIARHKVIDYYRKKKVKQVFFSQIPEEVLPLISAFLGPEEEFDAKEMRGKINAVFYRLKPRYRRVLVMKYIEGFTVREIARTLSVTVKSVESMLFRARMAFAQSYRTL